MQTGALPTADQIRDVTDEEIAAFRRDGWVKLDGLLTPELAETVRQCAVSLMGEDVSHYLQSELLADIWRKCEEPSEEIPYLKGICASPQMGRVASRLLHDIPIRYIDDEFLIKMPAKHYESSPTVWHQDYPHGSRDRSEQLMVWIALNDVPPERGSLRFITGSHRLGVLGRMLQDPSNGILEQYPHILQECEIAPPLDLKAGDATVHHSLTIHSAPENTSDEIRWAYTIALFHGNALYNGAQARLTDKLGGFTVNKPFDHPRTPLIWPGVSASA
jgi:ectoine hydroxylase-related dioxygenase (phytanoyl-CoA dioxygenase family)